MFTVGQFARICNVSTKALRHYDEIGLFQPAAVGPDNQYRYYEPGQIKLMRRVLFLRDLGVGLETIGELMRSGALADPARLEAVLSAQAASVSMEIASHQDLLSRIQNTVAEMRREGAMPDMTDQPVVVKEVPEVQVVGVRRTIAMKDINQLFPEAARKMRARPAGPPMSLYYDTEFDPEHVDVEVLFPVTARGERTLPGRTVASVVHVGPYDAVSPVYAKIFAWVNENKRRVVGPPREIYLVGPESGKSPAEYVTEMQLPIE